MMRTSLLCVMLAFGSTAFGRTPAAASAQPQYRITGTLVSSTNGSPVPHGHLMATLVGTGAGQGQRTPLRNTFDADDQGKFTITLPSTGMWNLTAWGRGFVRNGYLGHELYSSGVVLTRDHPSMDIRFTLSPQAEIKGIVTDEAGEAVRDAHVTLLRVPLAMPEGVGRMPQHMMQTDDRGMYEFDELEPGEYRLCVTAQPWYAVAAARMPQNSNDAPPLDPSLDVAYPVTWFPGSADPDTAEAVILKAGDVREADFHLRPVPALHLLIDPPSDGTDRHNGRFFPVVQRLDGGNNFVQPVVRTNAQGQVDVGGLTPGLYQIQLLGPGAPNLRTAIEVTGDGGQTVNFNGTLNEANVSVQIDGIPEDESNSLMVSLVAQDGRIIASTDRVRVAGLLRPRPLIGIAPGTENAADKDKPKARTLSVPPGKYDVVLLGGRNGLGIYLGGITAAGAQTAGRQVTLPAGPSNLTVHVVQGRATLAGFVTQDGEPSVGTLVMLVPASLGEAGALQIVRRDESNTDGSFNLADVIPGQYILIAVENAWNINWKDKAMLARYLDAGVAVDLSSRTTVNQNIEAQQP